jgi:hypothetical protein
MFESGHPILERVILLATKNILENKYPNDVMKMTGPLVLTEAVNQIHAELFEDPIPYEIMDETTDITFDRGGIKYRIYSQDYGEFCIFECIHHQYLYINRPKWVDQIRYTPLLVGGTVNPDMV